MLRARGKKGNKIERGKQYQDNIGHDPALFLQHSLVILLDICHEWSLHDHRNQAGNRMEMFVSVAGKKDIPRFLNGQHPVVMVFIKWSKQCPYLLRLLFFR